MPISNPSYFPPSRSNGSVVGITAGTGFTGARSFLGMANAGNFSSDNDLIILGQDAFSAGVTDATLDGSIAIGTSALQNVTTSQGAALPNTAIGFEAGQALQFGGGNVMLGDLAMGSVPGALFESAAFNVVVGSRAAQTIAAAGVNPSINFNVIIGAGAVRGHGQGAITTSVVIGASAVQNLAQAADTSVTGSVVIGNNAGVSLATAAAVTQLTLIGSASDAIGALNSVGIGADVNLLNAQNTVLIGAQAVTSAVDSVMLGCGIPDHHTVNAAVLIGANANQNDIARTNKLLIEVAQTGSTHPARRLIYGDFGVQNTHGADGGNLILGDGEDGAGDDFPVGAINTVRMLNGAKGTTGTGAPASGGYFYVVAGELHYVGTDGTDTKLSSGTSPSSYPDGWVVGAAAAVTATGDATVRSLGVNALASIDDLGNGIFVTLETGVLAGSGGLIATSASLTDHSAAAAGTLTNAPAAGNPTKWIAINDNGVLRGIPTWLI